MTGILAALRRRVAAARTGGDDGFVLLLVLGTMIVTLSLLLVLTFSVLGNSTVARAQQDGKDATGAAQAGIEDYVARLNADPEYWSKSDTANAAFATTGRELPGLAGAGPKYRYRVLSTAAEIRANGVIQLEVTGTSSARNGTRTVTRVMRAALTTQGFVNYAYFSDLEVADPSLFSSANTKCANYYYTATTGRATLNSGNPSTICPEVPWTTGDVVAGGLHTNDAPYLLGTPTFSTSPVESGWAAGSSGKYFWGSGTPSGNAPTYSAPTSIPAANTSLLRYVEPRPDGGAAGPGCLYKGATKITFTGTTMSVYSPGTTDAPARCLVTANRANLQTGLAIPPLIYVLSTTTSCSAPSLGFPATGEYVGTTYRDATAGATHTTDYGCARGTAYVSGTATAKITVASENDIVITGDLAATDRTGTDMIGLISGESTWVYHPVTETATTTTICNGNIFSSCASHTTTTTYSYGNLLTTPITRIDASILAVSHSFLVQNPDRGNALSSAGTAATKLSVYGSVAQKYRGPVARLVSGAYTSGYLVNYTKDPRLTTQQPPYFLAPTSSPWSVSLVTDG